MGWGIAVMIAGAPSPDYHRVILCGLITRNEEQKTERNRPRTRTKACKI